VARGRPYTGHAIDQMQGRGVPPSVVEHSIGQGTPSPDPIPNRTRYYEPVNNITVVTEQTSGGQKVVTVVNGKL
jgi:hypothetical protein